MKPVEAFRNRVSVRIPELPDALIDDAVVDTCIDFCERSTIVRRNLDTFTTVAGRREYDIDACNMQSVTEIVRVWCDSSELVAVDDETLPLDGRQSTPRYFLEEEPGRLALYPIPNKAYTINVRAALRPQRGAKMVADTLYENWVEVIVAGALARLYAIPGDFFNAALAQANGAGYMAGVNSAMLQAGTGNTRVEHRTQMVRI